MKRNVKIHLTTLCIAIALFNCNVYAQCDFYRDIIVSADNFELSNTQEYVLVEDNAGSPGNILAINSTGNFIGFPAQTYWVYAVNYEGLTPTELAIGLPWSGVVTYDSNNANCIDLLEAYNGGSIELCDPLSICEPNNLEVSTIGETMSAGYIQDYVLVNSSNDIIAFNTTGIFTIGDYLADGDFEIYAVNTNDSSVLDEISDLGAWSDVENLLSGPKCLDILLPVYIEVLDENDPSCVILPIELLQFTGVKVNETNLLKWTTATEINNERFEILSSSDGLNFMKIGEIGAAGNSSNVIEYNFVDEEPQALTTYYKLKQIDYNLVYTYSNIISLSREGESFNFSIYPNPAKNFLKLDFVSNEHLELQLTLVDVIGKVITVQNITIEENNKESLIWNINNLANGSYTILMKSSLNNISHQFIKIE